MITAQNLHKTYREAGKVVHVLKGLDFEITPGLKAGIIGASGSGKSTLLHVLGGLDSPDAGKVLLDREDLYSLEESKRSRLRNRFFGFVFQFYHLLPELTALENTLLPILIAGRGEKEAGARAAEALGRVGLGARLGHRPPELSGGEQQRVALARACVLGPKLILADEPTGNLDAASGEEVMGYLLQVVELSGGALVLVTHNTELAERMDRVLELKDGRLWEIKN